MEEDKMQMRTNISTNHTLAGNIGHWSSKASETARKMTHKRSCWRCPSRSSWRSAHWWWTPSSHSRWCWPEQTPDSSSAHQHRCHHRHPCFLNKTHDRFFILKPSQIEHTKDMHEIRLYIYIYAFSRRFYPKQAIHILVSTVVPWESNPQPFALLTQCSTTEPHRNSICTDNNNIPIYRDIISYKIASVFFRVLLNR